MDEAQYAEMLAVEIVSDQIAHALVECGRALEIGEQESEACNLESLIALATAPSMAAAHPASADCRKTPKRASVSLT